MNKKTLYGAEAREKILAGVKKIVDAVKVTLGSSGRNVVIAQSAVIDYGIHNLPIHISKDGFTVARAFDCEDFFEKVGVMMIKEVCTKTVEMAGDGTTTSAVLAGAIIEKGIELINAGVNPMELKIGIDRAVEYVVSQLKGMAIPVGDDNEKIFQVATVSANNDAVIGRLIADAFNKIGNDGVINIQQSQTVNTEIKISDGFKIERGWLSPLFINNKEKQTCEFDNPLILMYQNRITHHTQFENALTMSMREGRPIVIICEDADEEGLAVLISNNLQKRIACCVVKTPYIGDVRRETMEDLAVATGGTYISDIKGVSIKEVGFEYFGQAKRIIISKDETIIIGGNNNKEEYEGLIADLKMNLAQAKGEDEKANIEKRIARLTGGIAVIYVGATTETEMNEKLDRYDDAIRATKAAIAEGFVAGGGISFLRIDYKKYAKSDAALILIQQILREPFKQILTNAGVDVNDIEDKVLIEKNVFGYNAKTGQIENLIESGIIDPVKVLRCALENAASSAGMILTCECAIVDTL